MEKYIDMLYKMIYHIHIKFKYFEKEGNRKISRYYE